MKTITLGPFAVRSDGALAPCGDAPRRPVLRFAWRGRDCGAEIEDGRLRLTALAARTPCTAEVGADRRRAFSALAALPAALPDGWRLRLLPDHRVQIEAAAALASPATATALVAALVRFALTLDLYLDRLEEAGLGWSGGGDDVAGTAKTWPG